MKKEIVVAILLGLSLGLFITYGLYRSRNAGNSEQTNVLGDPPDSSPSASVLSTLVLHSPADESIVAEEQTTIAGDTEPNNFIVIFVNDQEYITTADNTGAFSIGATLEAGSNVIMVHSINEDGKTTVEERMVVFSTVPLIETTETEEQPSPSPTTSPRASARATPRPTTTP